MRFECQLSAASLSCYRRRPNHLPLVLTLTLTCLSGALEFPPLTPSPHSLPSLYNPSLYNPSLYNLRRPRHTAGQRRGPPAHLAGRAVPVSSHWRL
jgi:hypothetical protein